MLLPAALVPGRASAQTLMDVANLEEAATGLSSPLFAVSPVGDTTRLFVVQQGGVVRLVKNGQVQSAAFLDVSALLTPNSGTVDLVVGGQTQTFSLRRGGEQGLLGLALAPDYDASGVFYIYYVGPRQAYSVNTQALTATDVGRTYIARMTRSAANPDVAGPAVVASQANVDVIFQTDQPFTNHNGGCMQFGPDGMLYVGLGDGGSANDPGNRALNPGNILGKMLRLDVGVDDFPADMARDYGIPAGNPFAGGGGLPEIWARGLRNPWRWSFDRLTGDLWIGDVGQDQVEEIDWVPGNGGAGRNYGWRVREGTRATGLSDGGFDVSSLTGPVHTYTHATGISVTGGYVYRGSAIRAWRGRYVFADFAAGTIWSGRLRNGVLSDVQDHSLQLSNLGTSAALRVQSVASFGEDASGELYVVQLNGRVRRIVPQLPQPCLADVDDGTGLGHPDGGVTIEDLLFYLDMFEAGDLLADVDDGTGTGSIDDGVTIDDLLYYLERFGAGC